jgi:hypothetical protein
MTARFLKRDLLLALKIVLGFVAKKAAQWDWLCRELFFTPALPPALLREYKERLALDSVVAIDVKDFLKELPSLKADEETGMGRWVGQVPHRLVIGEQREGRLGGREGGREGRVHAEGERSYIRNVFEFIKHMNKSNLTFPPYQPPLHHKIRR